MLVTKTDQFAYLSSLDNILLFHDAVEIHLPVYFNYSLISVCPFTPSWFCYSTGQNYAVKDQLEHPIRKLFLNKKETVKTKCVLPSYFPSWQHRVTSGNRKIQVKVTIFFFAALKLFCAAWFFSVHGNIGCNRNILFAFVVLLIIMQRHTLLEMSFRYWWSWSSRNKPVSPMYVTVQTYYNIAGYAHETLMNSESGLREIYLFILTT